MQEEVVHVGLFVDKLNYESIQSFRKAFRKETGMSPREYKKRHTELCSHTGPLEDC